MLYSQNAAPVLKMCSAKSLRINHSRTLDSVPLVPTTCMCIKWRLFWCLFQPQVNPVRLQFASFLPGILPRIFGGFGFLGQAVL